MCRREHIWLLSTQRGVERMVQLTREEAMSFATVALDGSDFLTKEALDLALLSDTSLRNIDLRLEGDQLILDDVVLHVVFEGPFNEAG